MLLGRGENSIFETKKEIEERLPELNSVEVIADVTNVRRMRQVMERKRPDVIFHSAAHKHVPLMELYPQEAFVNNILGTKCLLELSEEYSVERFILLSTDKAVNPISVMGMTKRICERLIRAFYEERRVNMVAVRFGNVVGSRGSVIPLFIRQIENGGPVTVTDPKVERYFMTIKEASQLVINAAGMGAGGEIFMLDMGEPVKILDVARKLIEMYHLKPDRDIKIQFMGLRPGEKLYEELISDIEELISTEYEKIYLLKSEKVDREKYICAVDSLAERVYDLTDEELKNELSKLL